MKNGKGYGKNAMYAIGQVCLRTRNRYGKKTQRAFIKVAEPSVWKPLALHVVESHGIAVPKGFGIHHVDGNPLNDTIENLRVVSMAEHLKIHRPEFAEKAVKSSSATRRLKRWSTKSSTKITGRHPNNCQCPLHKQAT